MIKPLVEGVRDLVLHGAMASISAKTIRENTGKPWSGDRATHDILVNAQGYVARQSPGNLPRLHPDRHAIEIIAAARVQVVAEGWGAEFPFGQAWSQSQLQLLVDLKPVEA